MCACVRACVFLFVTHRQEEGEELIADMKKRYSATIQANATEKAAIRAADNGFVSLFISCSTWKFIFYYKIEIRTFSPLFISMCTGLSCFHLNHSDIRRIRDVGETLITRASESRTRNEKHFKFYQELTLSGSLKLGLRSQECRGTSHLKPWGRFTSTLGYIIHNKFYLSSSVIKLKYVSPPGSDWPGEFHTSESRMFLKIWKSVSGTK